MHIGIDSRLPYYQIGGISAYVINLVSAMAELHSTHRFTVFHSRKDVHDYVTDQMEGFSRADLWTPCHHRLERWALGAELYPHRLELFHSPDFIPPAFGAPCRIITVHDLNFLLFPEFLTSDSRRHYNDQIEWAVRSASHILADSNHTRRDLIERVFVPPEKVTTIPLAAGSVFSQHHSLEAIKATMDSLGLMPGFILFVGTISPRKNVKMLLEAFEILVLKLKLNIQLVLAGAKGWLADDLFTAIASSPVRDLIVHLPSMTDTQMAHLYSSAQMLVIPSLYEGFGLPVLEAMHCRCPVVSSNQSSLPEVVGNAGILLDPNDPIAWSESMKRLLEDEAECDHLVNLGLEQVKKFSWRRTAEATMLVYEECLAQTN
jgi:glycosyltransferase involved in cell wall biosynthesis